MYKYIFVCVYMYAYVMHNIMVEATLVYTLVR